MNVYVVIADDTNPPQEERGVLAVFATRESAEDFFCTFGWKYHIEEFFLDGMEDLRSNIVSSELQEADERRDVYGL